MNSVPSSDHERLARLNQLLEEALALPEADRSAWLSTLPAEAQGYTAQLQALLARARVDTDTFMQRPAALALAGDWGGQTGGDRAGDIIGPYRLIHELGAGGMATVWLAERVDGLLLRQVALKLPREGWAVGLGERMARERDILAALEHPLIARLYDAGITSQGRPWLAMERVTGLPIDVYCRERGLDVRQRLRLFLQVIDAVAHAHARLIVHRDLKPNNIYVTEDGEVRLLDFGVAKLLGDETSVSAGLTQLMGRAVTPDYASPEQIAGRPVGVATDVYSLGVVFYELLTGQRPYRLSRVSVAALEEAILAADVPLPSARVMPDRRLARQLRGDLDTVLVKALRKHPAQRYASVESMGADLQRHLDGEPIRARPPSRGYRAAKFLRRHRWPVAAASAVVIALAAGLGTALWQAQEATRQRTLAQERLETTEATLGFTNLVLTEGIEAGETLTLDALVRRSEELAESHFATTPRERALAALAVVDWYNGYGAFDRAEALLNRTLASLPADFDRSILHALNCRRALARARQGRVDVAARDLDAVISTLSDGDRAAVGCLQARALTARKADKTADALRFSQQALDGFEKAGLTSLHQKAQLTSDLAYAYSLNGQPGKARVLYERAAGMFATIGRGESGFAASLHTSWGVTMYYAGNPRAALEHFDRAIEITTRRSSRSEAPMALYANRGHALRQLGRYDDAIAAHQRELEIARRERSVNQEMLAQGGIAQALLRQDRVDAAVTHLDAAQAILDTVPPTEAGYAVLGIRYARALILQARGRRREADGEMAQIQESYERRGLKNGGAASVLVERARIALADRRFDDAQRWATQALSIASAAQGDLAHSAVTGQAWLASAQAHDAVGRAADARSACSQAIEHLADTVGDVHPETMQARALARRLSSA